MEAAVPAAVKAGAKKILEVRLKIGELSGVFPECIEACFSEVCKGTIAEGAKLVVEPIPIRIFCRDCNTESEVGRGRVMCPHCGSYNYKIIGGREYFVDSLKVE